MKPASVLVRVFAAVVALLLLGAIGHLLIQLTSTGGGKVERLVAASDRETRDQRSHGIEPAREDAMSIASIPWTRDSANPEPARIDLGTQPYIHRARVRAAVPLAYLPAMRPRHDVDRPTPAAIRAAEVPWGRLQAPAELAALSPVAAPADVPPIKSRYNPARAAHATLSPAEVPWTRLTRVAEVKSMEAATMPHLAARRDPEKPASSPVAAAALPWDRDVQNPSPAYVSAARVPSALKSAPKP